MQRGRGWARDTSLPHNYWSEKNILSCQRKPVLDEQCYLTNLNANTFVSLLKCYAWSTFKNNSVLFVLFKMYSTRQFAIIPPYKIKFLQETNIPIVVQLLWALQWIVSFVITWSSRQLLKVWVPCSGVFELLFLSKAQEPNIAPV